MCGIVCYIGDGSSRETILRGLSHLEYRGYDSAGLACINRNDGTILSAKSVGQLDNLVVESQNKCVDGPMGIGHVRWATHGQLSVSNAHPHFDCNSTVAIVHNGIVENHYDLKRQLSALHQFQSATDTEVLAHFLEELLLTHSSVKESLIAFVTKLEGAFACAVMIQAYPEYMVAIRKRAPLCIGIAKNNMTIASDTAAFGADVERVLFLPDASFALVSKDQIELYHFDGTPLPINSEPLEHSSDSLSKGEHAHFMLKEMYEQQRVIGATVDFLEDMSDAIWTTMGLDAERINTLQKINVIGCGTSWHAGRIAKFFFETICGIPTSVHLASEFRLMSLFPENNSIYVGVSQSGETADTLEALRLVHRSDVTTVALTNVASSTIVRETDGCLLTQAGREVAVASTKAFTAQLAVFYWLAHRIALERGLISVVQMERACQNLLIAAQVLENGIEQYKREIIERVKKQYAYYERYIFLGRHVSYIAALEAALKLKEISYIFSIGYPAGELKHGPIALIDAQTPIVLFSHADPHIYQKLVSNAQEVKARNGHLITFAFEGQDELVSLSDWSFMFPRLDPLLGPLAMTGVTQFLAYQIALELGCAIDKPRNLAKSVTVE